MRTLCRQHRRADSNGEKGAVVRRWGARLGVDKATVHRWIKKRVGRSKEVDRSHQRSVPTELVDWVARRKIEGERQSLDAREVATERCLEEARRRGLPGADEVSASHMNALLREAGFRVEEYRTLVEADYANQVWQVDFSRSKYMQVRRRCEGGDDYLLEKSGRHLHYKENGNLKNLWLVAAKDHHSRVPISRGYIRRGETAMLGLDFFDHLFNRAPGGPVCLRGLPEDLKCDNGAFAKAQIVKYTFEEVYGIALPTSTPYNSASQGLIERNWRSLWSEFELPLVFTKPEGWTIRLSDYNALLLRFCAEKAAQEHPTKAGRSREDVYLTSCLEHAPRRVEGSIMRHACHIDERVVDGYHRVRIENDFYDVPKKIDGEWTIQHETELRVFRSLDGRVLAKLKGREHKPVEIGDWEPGRYGDFAAGSAAQKGETYREEQERRSEEEEAARAPSVPPEENASPAKGAVAEADVPDEPEKLDLNDARKRLGNALLELALPEDDRHQWLAYLQQSKELHPGMTRAEVDRLAEHVREAVRDEREATRNQIAKPRTPHGDPSEGGEAATMPDDAGTDDTGGGGQSAEVAHAA
jgi:hypothetical protein